MRDCSLEFIQQTILLEYFDLIFRHNISIDCSKFNKVISEHVMAEKSSALFLTCYTSSIASIEFMMNSMIMTIIGLRAGYHIVRQYYMYHIVRYRSTIGFGDFGSKLSPQNQLDNYFLTLWEYCLGLISQAQKFLQINLKPFH